MTSEGDIDEMMKDNPQDLLDFLYEGPTASHQVALMEKKLCEAGFVSLEEGGRWKLEVGGKYYLKKQHAGLIAFKIGTEDLATNGLRLIGAHTDSPSFKLKSIPEMVTEETYLKFNTEMYGGAIAYTWFDRPLSLAGQVVVKSDDPLKPSVKLVNFNRPLLTIPSVAIHLNPTVNTEFKVNNQKDMLPLIALVDKAFKKAGYLQKLLAKEIGVPEADVLSFELELYAFCKGTTLGVNEELIQAQGLDDKWMVYAALMALLENVDTKNTQVGIFVDNEEIGSLTARGAHSTFVAQFLKRMTHALGYEGHELHGILEASVLLSADLAHGVHPNAGDLHDPTHRPVLGGGPVVKVAASGSYSTDATGLAIFKGLCEKAEVPYQMLYNRSDKRGGTTIGPMIAALLSARVIDMGAPLLAMHSIQELASVKDHQYVMRLFETLYTL
ncbi:MAG: M18 family aminopeptidase [Defluviitaleaceae bacterium]|nr:M18 family aminopeptidase [Defluviitaleaceae bacterium]